MKTTFSRQACSIFREEISAEVPVAEEAAPEETEPAKKDKKDKKE